MIKKVLRLLVFVLNHPLNRNARLAAIGRVIRWQLASRLIPGVIALPFVNGHYLFAKRGMTGATGNWYCGLDEYEDMSFILDFLGNGNLFVDVGANVGSYSILAASKGAEVIAVEPVPETYQLLRMNVSLNNLSEKITSLNIGLSSEAGELLFSTNLDTVNHVQARGDVSHPTSKVPVYTLDEILGGRIPSVVKIDVEGFEFNVIAGSSKTLGSSELSAVIVELNGSGKRYGFDDCDVLEKMISFDFDPVRYEPETKRLIRINSHWTFRKNVIFLKRNTLQTWNA